MIHASTVSKTVLNLIRSSWHVIGPHDLTRCCPELLVHFLRDIEYLIVVYITMAVVAAVLCLNIECLQLVTS